MRPTQALDLPRQLPAKRPASARVGDFEEIDQGLTPVQAIIEAQRCVQCSEPPCSALGCPLGNDIPRWIDLVVRGRLRDAANVLARTSAMPEICGRLCPHEILCESSCVVGRVSAPVSIGRLEEYVARTAAEKGWIESSPTTQTGKRVAIVGSGPAGLAAADRLLTRGHAVVVFEQTPLAGGVPIYGIPSFKFAKKRVTALVDRLQARGAEFRCGVLIGTDITVDDLFAKERFDALLLAVGAPRGRVLDLPGSDLNNIYMATEFLINGNLPAEQLLPEARRKIVRGRTCAVVGAGDTAADCVRTAVRLGFKKVINVYRRSEEEMPGRVEDRNYAAEEGVELQTLANPIRFEGGEKVERMVCVRMKLGDADESGRRRPAPIEGSEFSLETDAVVLALGYQVDLEPLEAAGCEIEGGAIKVDRDLATTREGVFAAGDVVNGADLVVTAVRDGRNAAEAIDRFLK